jgi:hypothetical protein
MKKCGGKSHNSTTSVYDRSSVPKSHFENVKDPKKPFITCIHCREYSRKIAAERKLKKDEKNKELILEASDFRVCTSGTHNSTSTYPHDKVPLKSFLKDPADPKYGEYKRCMDCRKGEANNRKEELEKMREDKDGDPNFGLCNYHSHHIVSSYPQNHVPIENFFKNPEDRSFQYKNCQECRFYVTNGKNVANKERKEISENYRNDFSVNTEFLYCPGSHHNIKNVSIYPRDKVPSSMFQKYSDDFEDTYENCSDCRAYSAIHNNISIENKKLSAREGEFYCEGCKNYKNETQRGIKMDGTPSKNRCSDCKIKEKNRKLFMRQTLRDILYERFLNVGSCCQKCKSIFLKPSEGTFFARKLETYIVDKKIYVDHAGASYLSHDFLIKFKDCLEYRIIEMDHLTEEEQRERGILLDNEEYEAKISQVSACGSEKSMRRESKKCQVLCSICHVEETIRRCENFYENNEKQEYVNKLKMESGCSSCNYKTNTPRILEMDHLDPKKKIRCISEMVQNGLFNLNDVIEECKKCRVLCRNCHRIHTDEQRKNGVISNQKRVVEKN